MSNKMECPGCHTVGSNVTADYQHGRPCRTCGLAPETADEITAARRRGADATLTEQLTETIKRAAAAETERDRLKGILARLVDGARDAAAEVGDRRPWERSW